MSITTSMLNMGDMPSKESADNGASTVPIVEIPTQAGMSALARYINTVFVQNADHRRNSGIDDKLLRSLRACKSEYGPEEAKKLQEAGISEDMFTPITDTKRRAAHAQLNEIFNAPGDKPWVVKPTPMPTVPESVAREAFGEIISEFVEFCQQTGQIPPAEAVSAYAEARMDEVHRKEIEWSNIRAGRMELKVHDQMVEGGWIKAFGDYCNYIVTYGTALVKGPTPRVVLQRAVKETKVGTYKYVMEHKEILCYEAVSPWDCYPSKGSKSIDEGNICIRVRFTSDELSQFSKSATKAGVNNEKGEWLVDTVKALVEKYPNGGVSIQGQAYDILRQRLENDGTDANNKCINEGIEFFGNVKGSELMGLGIRKTQDGKAIDYDMFYEVDAISIENYVIYCKVIDPCVGRPLSKGVFYEAVDSWWGDSIADKLIPTQKTMNSALRNLVTNMAMTSGPEFWVKDVSRLVDKSSTSLAMKPWKVHQFQNGALGQTDIPMGVLEIPSKIREILEVFNWAKTQADEDSGIPAYTYGTNVSGGAGRTASGLAMLTEAANRGMKMVISITDRDVIRDVVKRTVSYNLVYDDDMSIKGDCEVNPAGVMGMILKEQESQRRKQMLSLMVNPIIYGLTGPKGLMAVLRPELQSLGIANVDDVLPSKERVQEIEDLQKLQQLQQAQMGESEINAQNAGALEQSQGMTQGQVAQRDVQQNPQEVASRGDPAMREPSQVEERRGVA